VSEITVAVLGDPADPTLAALRAPDGVRLKIGKTAEALEPELRDASVLFYWFGPKEEVGRSMELAPNLKWIHARFAGLDRILFPALVESPIPLTNGTGVFSQSLGEWAILGALWFAKDLPRMIRAKTAHRWDVFDVDEISKQTMGIVGHGDIGRAVARRAKALDMRVLALRRNTARREGDEHVDQVYAPSAMHEMLAQCDYVVVAAPLTPATLGLVGRPEFNAMKPSAILMNIGRGPVVDEAALIDALRSGRIRGAVLDVFDTEPLPPQSPFWEMENVLISAHCADHTRSWLADSVSFFFEQLARWRAGQPLKNVVDKHAGY
jgi:phosphoglycerate dehydrogenase-like enzyme